MATDNHPEQVARVAEVIKLGVETVADLREVVDWLTDNWRPGMPVPRWSSRYVADMTTTLPRLGFWAWTRSEYEATVRALAHGAPKAGPNAVRKGVADYATDNDALEASRLFGRIEVRVWVPRDQVCSSRVVGTETVEVPDPDAPLVTVERPVVEWDCAPVLSEDGP